MNALYCKHYIATDNQGCITDGWSDGPHRDRDTTDAICINEQGGYQFRLFPGGEENPLLRTMDGVLLYRWNGETVEARTEEEIVEARLPDRKREKLSELSSACHSAVIAGCDVILSTGSGHISLTTEDQINLDNAYAAVKNGAVAYPYHLNGSLFALYSTDDILSMVKAANSHKLYHTIYYNHLAEWVGRANSKELDTITYGKKLPDDLAASMGAILVAASDNNAYFLKGGNSYE